MKKEIKNIENDQRYKIEEKMFSYDNPKTKNQNYNKIKKASDNISQDQGKEFIERNEKYSKLNQDINNNIYEVNCGKNKNNINIKDIEIIFAGNGVHFDFIEIGGFLDAKPRKKIIFKIRKDKNDINFLKKVEDIKNYLKKNKNVEINYIENGNKRKNEKGIPNSVKWNNPNMDLCRKNKSLEKSKNDKSNINNIKGEKITNIIIDTKYKNYIKFKQNKKTKEK